MSADIHMFIVRKDKKPERIFEGVRDPEWFDDISGNGYHDEYEKLPIRGSISPFSDENIKDDYENCREKLLYGFYYFNVGEFREWFIKCRPNIKAGWVTTYDNWRIKNNKWFPDEDDLSHVMLPDVNPDDQFFIEYEDPYDMSARLYDLLNDNNISDDADITYYFGC